MNVTIEPAQRADADEILQLQYVCFRQEAALYGDYDIPPLKQTIHELLSEYESHCILVARCEGGVVGSVRAVRVGGRCQIGRLIVDPRIQRQGIGTRLMNAVEAEFADVAYYELFTGSRSEGNLRLYKGLGYKPIRTRTVSPVLEMVFLEKPGRATKTSAACLGIGS